MDPLSAARVDRAIDEIERSVQADDPALVRQFQAARRADDINTLAVAGLLVTAAVLMVVGFATYSWTSWFAGALAFVASATIDELHKRRVRRGALRAVPVTGIVRG